MSILFGHIMSSLNSKFQWIILSISIHMIHEFMHCCLPEHGCFSCHIFMWILLFTPSLQLVVEKYSKRELPIYGCCVAEYQKYRAKFCCCVLTPPIDQILVLSNFRSLCEIQNSNAIFRTAPTPQITFYYFHHWITWAPSSSVYYFISPWIRFHHGANLPTFYIKTM